MGTYTSSGETPCMVVPLEIRERKKKPDCLRKRRGDKKEGRHSDWASSVLNRSKERELE